MSAPSRKPPPRRAAAAASSVQNPAPRRSGLTSAAAKINSTIRPAPQGPTVVDPKPHPHKLPDASSPEHLRALRVSAWARDALGLGLVDTAVFWAEVALSLLGGGPAHIVAPVPEKEPNAKAEAFAAKSYIVTTLMDALLMKCEFERIVLLSADVKTYGDVLRDAKFRSITVQALIKLDRHDEAMAHLNAPDNADASAVFHHPATSFIPFQPKSQVYFMKGTVQKTLGNNDEAKKMWLEALKADARCFDAFQALIHGCLLTFDEESRLLQSLAIRKCVDESDVELVTLLYQVQLKVYGKMPQISADLKKLEDFYGLKNNATIMYARAVLLAMQSRPSEAVEVTERLVNCCVVHHIEKFTSILKVSPTHVQTIFLHTSLLAMMQTRQSSNALFLHAHSLVNAYPALAASWYAVGCYYLSVSKTSAAREAFEKACRIDPGCGEAWVAHGHALSLEGSSEEAVHAYSIAWKSYSGIHTPSLFIGMQYAQLGKSKIGEEYLKIASEICSTDPLVENEFGVLAFNRKEAVEFAGSEASRYPPFDLIWCNLGNAFRNIQYYSRAKLCFKNSLSINSTSANCLASLGIVEDLCGEYDDAILHFHEALSYTPENTLITDFLNETLRKSMSSMSNFYDFLPEFEGLDKPQIFGMRDESEPALAATRIHDTLKPGLFRQRTSFGSTFGDSDSDRGTPIVPLRQGLLFGVQRQPGESAMLGDEEELLDDRRRGFAVPRVPLTRRGSRRATFTPFGSSPFGAGGSSGSESAVRRMSPARGMQGRAGVVSRTSVPVDADAEAEEADVDMEMD